jgi:hypothetical protein
MKIQSIQIKIKKIYSKFDKNLGCYRLPPLKEISSLRFEEARKVKGFGILGGLPPLNEIFVGSLGLWVQMGHTLVLACTGSSFVPIVSFYLYFQ